MGGVVGTTAGAGVGAGAGAGATAGSTVAGGVNSLFGTSVTAGQADKALGLAKNAAGGPSPSDPSLQPSPSQPQRHSLADIPILGDPQVQQLLQAIIGGTQ